MSRLNYLSFIVVCGGLGALLAGTAQSQGGVKNLLIVQPTTPGTQQSGHTNISGTSRAGQFVGGGAGLTGVNASQLGGLAANQYGVVNNNNTWIGLNSFTSPGNSFTGNGAGLTNVNAAQLGGLPSSAYLQSIPNPLALNGNVTDNGVIVGSNSSSSFFARGVVGTLSSATPGSGASGVWGVVLGSTGGIGVLGQHNGNGFAVYGVTTDGTGVQGESTNGTALFAGTTTGLGLAISSGARGMEAAATLKVANFEKTGTSNEDAVSVTSVANDGVGIRSTVTGPGATKAIEAEAHGQEAFGVYARSLNTSIGTGVYGESRASSGTGVFGISFATSGTSDGVVGVSNSPSGTGVVATNNTSSGYALKAQGPSRMLGNVEIPSARLSIGAGASPAFPIDFSEGLGDKISLWGANPASHFGFGIQNNQFQIFTATQNDFISFGSGSSTNFTERARFTGSSELAFRPPSAFAASIISGPYDLVFSKDADNNSADEWTRVFTNAGIVEQIRVLQDDEAASLFDGAVTANGIDFAEGFKVQDPTIEPGDLVINSGNNWDYISLSNQPYQAGVIGVVSTKPAFVAGMSFDAEDNIDPELTKRRDQARREKNEVLEKQLTKQMRELVLEKYRPVAFMGRVPVKVVGPVKVGDKLTASNVPGKAMAMSRSGHSIGIALEATAGKDGTIMAMIQPGYVSLETGSTIPELLTKITEIVAENVRLKDRVEELENRLERLERLVDSKLK